MSTPVIIYDGECQLCLDWLCMKAEVEALSYRDAPLSEYGLTKERCEREVVVLAEGQTIGGAIVFQTINTESLHGREFS